MDMKSMKVKLMAIILVIVAVSSVVTAVIGVLQSFKATERIIDTLIEDKLISSNNMLKTYLDEQFGSLKLNNNGQLVDKNNKSIDGRFEYIDRFSQDMAVVATVFAKQGDSYVRVITTIRDEKGNRVVGTELDKNGQAYYEVSKGNIFYGEADILGSQYMTCYTPVYDDDGQIIGVYFVGVPIETVKEILSDGIESSVRYVVIITVLILLVAAIIIVLVSNRITRPIKKVTNAAQQIADGNFDVELKIKSKDEIGRLAEAFKLTIDRLINYQDYIDEISDALHSISRGDLDVELQKEYSGQFKKLKDGIQALIENLNSTLALVNEAAEQVTRGAEQVSDGAQTLSQGAAEQAASIEELSASIAEVSEQIRINAENAKAAREKAVFAGEELNSSNEQMNEMMAAMEKITLKSSEISKIIKIIEDIAFQTNILALNAAVEAARAGEAGKGFAVVAEEVGNLAGKSAAAAKNTTQLIEETINAVEGGSKVTGITAASLSKSAGVTMEAIDLIDSIAQASEEQSMAISQINEGIHQISSVVQTNAATAEESAAASEELSGQSNVLKEYISKFNFKHTENMAALEENASLSAHINKDGLLLPDLTNNKY